jgi:hypothetical protein
MVLQLCNQLANFYTAYIFQILLVNFYVSFWSPSRIRPRHPGINYSKHFLFIYTKTFHAINSNNFTLTLSNIECVQGWGTVTFIKSNIKFSLQNQVVFKDIVFTKSVTLCSELHVFLETKNHFDALFLLTII